MGWKTALVEQTSAFRQQALVLGGGRWRLLTFFFIFGILTLPPLVARFEGRHHSIAPCRKKKTIRKEAIA